MINLKGILVAFVLITSFGCARSVAVIDYEQPDFRNTPAIVKVDWKCGGFHHRSSCGTKMFATFEEKHYLFPKAEDFWFSGVAGLNIWPHKYVYHPYSYWVNKEPHYKDEKMEIVQIDVNEIKYGKEVSGTLTSSGYRALSHIKVYINYAEELGVDIEQQKVIEFANDVYDAYVHFSTTNPDKVHPNYVKGTLKIIEELNSKH